MTRLTYIAALVAFIDLSQAHFAFVRLAHKGVWQEPTRYIRNKTAPFEEPYTPNTNVNTRAYVDPTYFTDLPESVRCGRDHMAHAASTDVIAVKAGDTFEIAHVRAGPETGQWGTDFSFDDCPDNRGSCTSTRLNKDRTMDINHPGPFLAHLSKTPEGTDVRNYDGSGEWTKIYTLGLDTPTTEAPCHWLAYNYQGLPGRFSFSIPPQTPAGQYLLRLDMIWPSFKEPGYTPFDGQIYATCAQISVESEYSGDLPEGIKIPEGLSKESPGMSTSLAMYRQEVIDEGYVYPGGKLWDGERVVQDGPSFV